MRSRARVAGTSAHCRPDPPGPRTHPAKTLRIRRQPRVRRAFLRHHLVSLKGIRMAPAVVLDAPETLPTTSTDPSLRSRLARFVAGLALCALAVWLTVQVNLGLAPWDVLHSGLSHVLGMSFGAVIVAVGILVLVVSALLGVRPGLGTLVNVVLMGFALDGLLSTSWLDTLPTASLALRIVVLMGAVALLGLGAALYIGAGLGAGPRDSLMVAFAGRGLPIGWSRCAIELSVLAGGWLLHGPVGIGTAVVAVTSGPAVQAAFRVVGHEPQRASRA